MERYSRHLILNRLKLYGKTISIIDKEANLIYIQITGQKEKIVEAIKSIYTLSIDFKNEANKNNQKTFKQNHEALQSVILQKREMRNTIMSFFEERTISKLPLGTEGAVLSSLITLDSTLTNLEETKELNRFVQLMEGDFEIVIGNLKTGIRTSIDKNNVESIESYISPEKSKKRQLLPVIVSVFFAFFVGIFIAFVIEFFSREDIKRRLREIKNK